MKRTYVSLVIVIAVVVIGIGVYLSITNLFVDSQVSQFANRLNSSGLSTTMMGSSSDDILSPLGCRRILVDGEWVSVFVYSDSFSAEADALRLSSNGSCYKGGGFLGFATATCVDWVDFAHFYMNQNIIVLYVGHNSTLQNALQNILGPQFAGYFG
jgi:hypothetical protein